MLHSHFEALVNILLKHPTLQYVLSQLMFITAHAHFRDELKRESYFIFSYKHL